MGGDHLWEEVGAIGQVLGSIAVFVTLAYLAIQVRHARQETRRSISQGRAAAIRELAIHRSDNTQLNLGYRKAVLGGVGGIPPIVKDLTDAGLTPEESIAVMWDQLAFWAHRSSTVMQIDELTVGERAEFDIATRTFYGVGVGRLWYSTTKATLNPDAVRYIDNLLAQQG